MDRRQYLADRDRGSVRAARADSDVARRLHARRHRPGAALRGDEADQAQAQRIFAGERLGDHQRRGVGPAIMFCREALGPDRVLYAMDYPYEYVPEEVTAHENLPITPEEKASLFQTNAERVFRL